MRKDQKSRGRARFGGKAQAVHAGEVESAAFHFGDDRRENPGAQSFLKDP
jgi:hypothetical protein